MPTLTSDTHLHSDLLSEFRLGPHELPSLHHNPSTRSERLSYLLQICIGPSRTDLRKTGRTIRELGKGWERLCRLISWVGMGRWMRKVGSGGWMLTVMVVIWGEMWIWKEKEGEEGVGLDR